MNGVFIDDDREPARTRVVLLSSDDLAAAHRLMKILAEGSEAVAAQIATGDRPQSVTQEALIEAAWQEFERRGRRMQLFPKDMFGEPAWEMLLVLYAEHQRTRLTIARLTEKLDIPATTSLRWLNVLENMQLIVREPHPTDQRSTFVRLTPNALEMLELYLSEAVTGST